MNQGFVMFKQGHQAPDKSLEFFRTLLKAYTEMKIRVHAEVRRIELGNDDYEDKVDLERDNLLELRGATALMRIMEKEFGFAPGELLDPCIADNIYITGYSLQKLMEMTREVANG